MRIPIGSITLSPEAMQRFAVVLGASLLLALLGCVDVTTHVSREPDYGQQQQIVLSHEQLPLNHFQFFGSHNSYKRAIPPQQLAALRQINPEAAISLDYWHAPLAEQLGLGLRVLELDIFYDPQQHLFELDGEFPVLHVQNLDVASHCAELRECAEQILFWSAANPDHEPILISFNAKTDVIDQPGFIVPQEFDAQAWQSLDAILRESFAGKLLNPAEVLAPGQPDWPSLGELRGKFLLLLDEGPAKHNAYFAAVDKPAMFANVPAGESRAAILVLNDPVQQAAEIRRAIRAGYLVRTRADANTLEARSGSTQRRDAAFASGAHFISTDYYQPAAHFGTDYVVRLPGGKPYRCNPRVGRRQCESLLVTIEQEMGER